MYDKQQFKDWYEKTKPQRKIWQQEYYQKHKEHILEVHKDWAEKNVDHTGSVWRLYGRRQRIRNPNLDKEYRLRKKARLMYKPLPKELRLGFSNIHDIGLFAKEKIKKGHDLGVCHLNLGKQLFRTPLGGFVNHSDTPNCTKTMFRMTSVADASLKMDYKAWNLITLQDIKEGEELTLKYTFYKIYEERKN